MTFVNKVRELHAGRLKLIKNMQSKGFTLDQIAMAVDLRTDEVERMLAE